MNEPGIYILGEGKDGLFEGTSPQQLAGKHPWWEADTRRLSPWHETSLPDTEAVTGKIRSWKSKSAQISSAALICGTCSSTMDGVRELIRTAGLKPWDSLAAAAQKQGRGQMQRSWISPAGNLYVSWYWPDPGQSGGAAKGWPAMMSLLAGQITAEVLESFGAEVKIKWPNDILADDRKICGILVENRGGRLIVGIGLNLASAPGRDSLTDAFALPAASLREMGLEITPARFLLRLAERGRARFYQIIQNLSPAGFVDLLRRRLAWKGRTATVRKSAGEACLAEILGISEDGGLIVRKEGKKQVIYTGSLLPENNLQSRFH